MIRKYLTCTSIYTYLYGLLRTLESNNNTLRHA